MSRASKGEPVSEDQFFEMVDFIKEAPVLITNKPTMKERDVWKRKWEELSEILNETDGPKKTVAAWQKEWNLLRNLTKEKIKNIDTATQVRSPVKYKLTQLEEKVALLLRQDDDSMDTAPILEESNTRRAPKRQHSLPPEVSSVSDAVRSPSPSKRSRQVAQPPNPDDADEWSAVFFREIAAKVERQNESFLAMADAAVQIAESAAKLENECKVLVANNVKMIKQLESRFK